MWLETVNTAGAEVLINLSQVTYFQILDLETTRVFFEDSEVHVRMRIEALKKLIGQHEKIIR